MTREQILEENPDEEFVFLEPASTFDAALVGVTLAQPGRPSVLVYDAEKCVDQIEREMDEAEFGFAPTGGEEDSRERAEEYFEFNTVGAWMGERTPVFLRRSEEAKS